MTAVRVMLTMFALALTAATVSAQTVQLPVSDRTGRLEVRVVDTTALGMPGASVYLRSVPGRERLDVLTFSGSTGAARFEGLPAGAYKLVVNLPGFYESRRVVHVFPGGGQTIEVVLPVNPGACVVVRDHSQASGYLRDIRGRSLPRMVVVAEHDYWPTTSPVFHDGSFGWCAPPSAFYEVSVVLEPVGRVLLKAAKEAPASDQWRKIVDIPATQDAVRSTMLAHSMAPAARSTEFQGGRVVDSSGGVIPGASVTFSGLQKTNNLATSVVTGPDGTFDLPKVPPGLYRVTVGLSGFVGGVAYWRRGDTAPLLEVYVGGMTECVSVAPFTTFVAFTPHGIPLTGAHVVAKRQRHRGFPSELRGGRPECFTASAADDIYLDIEGLGEVLIKRAGVNPSRIPAEITVDWTALVARRLRPFPMRQ